MTSDDHVKRFKGAISADARYARMNEAERDALLLVLENPTGVKMEPEVAATLEKLGIIHRNKHGGAYLNTSALHYGAVIAKITGYWPQPQGNYRL